MSRSVLVAGTAVAVLLYAFAPPTASAREDCDAVAQSVRGKIASACPCDTAGTRGDYIRCVRRKLDELSKCTKNANGTTSAELKTNSGPISWWCGKSVASRFV